MEKRLFLAFFITLIFFYIWQPIMNRQAKAPAPLQQSGAKGIQPTAGEIELPSVITEEVEEEQKELPTAVIGDFTVTYSPTGGYIRKVNFKNDDTFLPFEDIGVIPEDKNQEFSVTQGKNKLIFKGSEGKYKEFIFNQYALEINFNPQPTSLVLFSNTLRSNGLDQRYQEIFYSQDGILKRTGPKRINSKAFPNLEFIGARDRYYCLTLVKDSYDVEVVKEKYKVSKAGKVEDKTRVKIYLKAPASKVSLYLGPQTKDNLEPFGLQEVVYYGFWNSLALIIVKLLHFFFFLTKNWGLSVILFSILTYALLFPLTLKSSKGMKEMREFQQIHNAEIAKIKEKYKNNQQKIHQATMEYYKKHGVNPLKGCSSGCLPMLFQFPIILAFWAVAPRAWEFKNAGFLWIKDLSLPDRLFHLPFSLPFSLGEWINILPLVTAAAMYVQMKLSSPGVDAEQAQQQKMMALFMPIMMGLFLYNMPSAMLLYWFTNSILTFFTQRKVMAKK